MEFMASLQDGLDPQKPSLFELLSEQQLAALLPPSIRYLLVLATQRHPRYLLRILNSFDELYALAMLVVERHYLLTYGGGFTENFYGLKRERVLRIKGGDATRTQATSPKHIRDALKLQKSDVWKNLVIMVGLPYIKRKLDESYDIHAPQAAILGPSYRRDQLPPDATLRQRIAYYYKWFLRNVYPSVNAAYYFSLLAFNVGYLFSNTAYSSPFLWLVQTRIRRLGAADYSAIALATETSQAQTAPARPGQNNSIFNPRTIVSTIIPRLLSSLRVLLPTSIFALKFLEWWHASDFARQLTRKSTEGLDLPPPVISGMPPSEPEKSGVRPRNSVSLAETKTGSTPTLSPPKAKRYPRPAPPVSSTSGLPILTVAAPTPSTSSLCPICLNAIATPTAAQTGYVFCYTCIFRWIEGNHERQVAWMAGGSGGEGWGDEEPEDDEAQAGNEEVKVREPVSREGKWENGKGRCPVTGRRLLGGAECLRRVMV